MSGDVQTRQRRKEKKKPKRDSVDQHSIFKRSSFEEEEISTVPGVDTSKFNEAEKKTVQMHIQESDHGAGICAKIIFFSLMAILLGLVTLIVLENRGGSDVDTPLSESRFSEYLTGWVDENREIDDHHVEPHFDIHDDDPDEETTHVYQKPVVPDDEPFPEERDNSNPDDDHEELNENLNNESENDEDDVISENQNEIDQQDEEQDEDNNENEVNDEPLRQEEEENNENEAADDDENEVPNMFDDSAPFDEEKSQVRIKREHLVKQVDELYDTYNEIAEMLGKNKAATNNNHILSQEFIKDDDDEDNLNSQEIFEKVIDNDAGEDLLLQKLAEESENAQQQQSQENDGEEKEEESSSQLPESGDSGAQSYMEEFLKQQALEENPEVKDLYEKAKSLDATAEREKSNKILLEAIEKYKELINVYGDKVNDTIFKEIAEKCIERMRFMGKLKQTVDIHYKLIHRFVENPSYRNQLAVTYLLGNRLSAAKLVLHETLSEWRNNGFALVHYGYVLKNLDQDYENAILYLREGIETNDPGTQDGRFYYNLGDALQRLGRQEEALEVYRKGASIGLFLSEYQRSLYNIDRLKSKPFWTKVETTYKDNLVEIQKYWQIIRDEGLKLLSNDGIFINEQENLKDTGDWKQFELFARGAATKYCHMAPITCKIINGFKAASSCKRGQVKFSVLHPNTHIHSHCGPTNCRIRAHLGLQVPEKTFIRVANETRSWKDGEWLIFDDSFEHEVWHNGTSIRLVLIVDMYHPDLTEDEKRSLSPI